MPQIQGINREQITFSNLESQIAKDNEIRFKDAFIEEFVSPVRSAKGRGMRGEVRIMMIAASYKDKMARAEKTLAPTSVMNIWSYVAKTNTGKCYRAKIHQIHIGIGWT